MAFTCMHTYTCIHIFIQGVVNLVVIAVNLMTHFMTPVAAYLVVLMIPVEHNRAMKI